MLEMSVENLKAGQTVYYVHALEESSFLTEYVVRGRPYQCKTIGLFLPCYKFISGQKLETDFSLSDCNVIPNQYNDHRLFFSRKKAESYLELCKLCAIGKLNYNGWGCLDWFYDDCEY